MRARNSNEVYWSGVTPRGLTGSHLQSWSLVISNVRSSRAFLQTSNRLHRHGRKPSRKDRDPSREVEILLQHRVKISPRTGDRNIGPYTERRFKALGRAGQDHQEGSTPQLPHHPGERQSAVEKQTISPSSGRAIGACRRGRGRHPGLGRGADHLGGSSSTWGTAETTFGQIELVISLR